MSTKFYGYQIEKKSFWESVDRVREFYRENHFMPILVREYVNSSDEEPAKVFTDLYDYIDDLLEKPIGETVELQVFDLGGADYFIRVLESSYFFQNSAENFDSFRPFFYNNQTDLSQEEKDRKPLIDKINSAVLDKHYFLVSILDFDDYTEIGYDEVRKISEANGSTVDS